MCYVDMCSSLPSQEYIARQVRRNEKPFGGIQVIFRSLVFLSTRLKVIRAACRLWRLLPVASCPGKQFESTLRLPGTFMVPVFRVSRHSPSCLSTRQPRYIYKKIASNPNDRRLTPFCRVRRHAQLDKKGYCDTGNHSTDESAIERDRLRRWYRTNGSVGQRTSRL